MKTLQIGDSKNAILLLQRSQTDPQKALAELIENSIDASAKNITITRCRRQGNVEITIDDDGSGVKAGVDGNPDFDRLANSLCDSYKKYLDQLTRENIQGEFGIGLLGFAAIGENLEMLSRADNSRTRYFRLVAGSIDFEDGFSRTDLPTSGTQVRIWPVQKDIQARLTAEKLNNYLGQELRERIRNSQVTLKIVDRLPGGRSVTVKPLDYRGEKIRTIDKIKTASGNIDFRLFVSQEGEHGRVCVYRRGTRVLDDITSIPELDHSPWNNEMLEGMIDSRFINISPASRRTIVPDSGLSELIEASRSVEPLIESELEKVKKQREEKLGRDLLKKLQETFNQAMRDLAAEYTWFGGKKGGRIPGTGETPEHPRKMIRLSGGPLDHVTIVPKIAQIGPNESKDFIAKAWSKDDGLIPMGVQFSWSIHPIRGSLKTEHDRATFEAPAEEGEVKLHVQAKRDNVVASQEALILILSKTKKTGGLNIPQIRFVDMPSENWRSKWEAATETLKCNSGHPNYRQAQQRSRSALMRYIAFLIAKHLVLHNYAHAGEEVVLERLIEVISVLEAKL